MSEALFGFIGVIVGAFVPWFHGAWADWMTRRRHARYLAIRVVCILDSYVESCTDVVSDDGLCEGQRNSEDCLEPQVPLPPAPVFSEDLDWKSIEHGLMYQILSLPSRAEAADRKISFSGQYADPPDFEEFFEERQDQYATLGLAVFALTHEIREKYGIPPRELGEWDPAKHFAEARKQVEADRRARRERSATSLEELTGE